MKSVSLIILAGFISLSLFGFMGMLESSGVEHAPNTCLASLAQNGICPPEKNTMASAIFHTNSFKVFSTTLLSVAVAIASLALFFVGLVVLREPKLCCNVRMTARRIDEALSEYFALQKLRTALVRFEHSPTS